MYLEIVSPEATLFSGEVISVTVPGVNGEFQMLKDHEPIVSLLQKGQVKLEGTVSIAKEHKDKFTVDAAGRTLLSIGSGTLEMKNNRAIVLAD
ncbi:F0F1 ATP synthase subunit epsilon [Maribacter sp. 2307ULW6-5]|uniref:F0F1 ATP synthase subunit epsilon n=1 Tax=Maribacter sp. 2307ULW6-5 TaxID=3386275 RepID=UPI0039BD59A0